MKILKLMTLPHCYQSLTGKGTNERNLREKVAVKDRRSLQSAPGSQRKHFVEQFTFNLKILHFKKQNNTT